MIPSVRWYRLKVADERVLYVQTITRTMAKLIVRSELPSTWGKALTIAAIHSVPELQKVSQGVYLKA